MLFSLSLIIVCGLAAGQIFKKLDLPPLLGMMLAGLLIGPSCFSLLDEGILDLSPLLRKIALLLILIRAGLNLSLDDLKRAGRPAILLCFVPATFEILAFTFLAPLFLGFDTLTSAILGCVMAAVSPAVVVPGMLKVIDAGYGKNKAIPQMILAGASADDIYVLVLFSVFTAMAQEGTFHPELLWRIPTAILLGVAAGILIGLIVSLLIRKFSVTLPAQVLILLAAGMAFYGLEDVMTGPVAFSGLIATMAAAMVIRAKQSEQAVSLAGGFNNLWKAGEIFLFVLIGAAVNISYAWASLPVNLLLIVCCLAIRIAGVLVCVAGTRLNWKERLFCAVSYLPKATVQAAIGATPLAMGLAGGQAILSCAVTAILVTAPLGAILIHSLYRKLLVR